MKCNQRSLATFVIVFFILGAILGACASNSPAATPDPTFLYPLPAPTPAEPATGDDDRSAQSLPPPLIITIPADQLDIYIDSAAAAAGTVTAQGNVSGGQVQFEDGLPVEVEALLQRIYQGDYPIDSTGQTPGSLPATFTYSDMNGDGIEDLVIILVVGSGDYSDVTAGSTQGNPVIQIVPRPEPGSVVEGLSIPIDEILAITGAGLGDDLGQGSYLITLNTDDLERWSDPALLPR